MIRLQRERLPTGTVQYLNRQTAKLELLPSAERAAESRRLWRQRSTKQNAAMWDALDKMASGLRRCMYCEDSAATDIDHFCPRAVEPLRTFDWTNLLAACSWCNSNLKRDAFPMDVEGRALLIDPAKEDPAAHLVLSPTTGRYVSASSEKGDASIDVFGLNRPLLVEGRRRAWTLLETAIAAYGFARDSGDFTRAEQIAVAIRIQPFAGVLNALLGIASGPMKDLVHIDCRHAIARYPDVMFWKANGRI